MYLQIMILKRCGPYNFHVRCNSFLQLQEKQISKKVKMKVIRTISVCILFSAASQVDASAYTFTDLGTLGGTNSYAFAINDSGQVAGMSAIKNSNEIHATVWNGTSATDLGTLGYYSEAFAINNAGQVVGDSVSAPNSPQRATLWNGTTATVLNSLPGGPYSYYAYGINNAGQVVGNTSTGGSTVPEIHAALWNGTTTATDLGPLGATQGRAYAINNTGQVAGDVIGVNAIWHAIVWDGTTATVIGTSLDAYEESHARAINDAGQVVGWTSNNGIDRATLWNGTIAIDLSGGALSNAYAINNNGVVVGQAQTIVGNDYKGFAAIWNGTTMTNLNSLLDPSTVSEGWELVRATGINDNGWVVGMAHNITSGQNHAFLLSEETVPEPATYALIMAGLGLLAFSERQRKSTRLVATHQGTIENVDI